METDDQKTFLDRIAETCETSKHIREAAAVARESGQLDCFITGNDGRVYTSWWHEGHDWSGINNNWRPIGGFFPVGV